MGFNDKLWADTRRNTEDIGQITTDIFNSNNGLRKWRSALAKSIATTYKAQINIVGDSISEGAYSSLIPSEWITKGYVGKIRTALSAKYGDCGTGIIPATFPEGSPYLVASGFVFNVGGANGQGFANYYYQSNTVGHTLTYSFSGTGVEIYYVQASGGGNFKYNIDGSGDVLVTARTTPTLFNKSLIITGLPDTTHSIVITQNDAGVYTQILGVCPIKGTKGVQINFVGKFGTTTESMAKVNSMSAEFGIKFPDLSIIALTANDTSTQVPLSTYETNLQTLITKAKLTGDVLLTTIGVRNGTYTIPQTDYIAVCKKMALLNNCAYLDIYSRWGNGFEANANGLLYDTVHPTEIGHSDISKAILKVVDEY